MITRTIASSKLYSSGKWRADLHVHNDAKIKSGSYEMAKLGEVVIESRDALDPNELDGDQISYIGLEHVAQVTGDFLGTGKVKKDTIRSRSKSFKTGDILYGRLRPYLRKALLVDDSIDEGICSTEFIILRAQEDKIMPDFLREMLVSEPVTERLTRMQGGAALPRVSSKDLLELSIPLPPLAIQAKIVKNLRRVKSKRSDLMAELEVLNKEGQQLIQDVF